MTLIRLILSLVFLVPSLSSAEEKEKASVWIFVAVDCPIANGYAPEMIRLQDDFESRGVAFTLIYPEPGLSESAISSHLKDYALDLDYHHDRDHSYVKKSGVTTTPEVAVFDANDQLVYRGKIDNRYTEFGDRRNTATETYLRDVLSDLLAGNPVEFRETEAIGCFIEALAGN